MISAGDLNKRIKIQGKSSDEPQYDHDGYLIENPEPTTYSVRAKVKPVSAQEYHKAKADQTENITRFIIRYRKGLHVDDSMKVIYKDRVYEIESVINDNEANITLTIMGREVS
ncbi:phage head closure protein [Halobacillus sp. Marseille-P3879]|uniref:phage head closure protein n=1 Tax=Halobacillus sp. Marseille-P3879 TaxID=2045014 RepID=UPI000C7B7107|nr:phage head closure protein [Halobacillus sp. Marseille-P3879]